MRVSAAYPYERSSKQLAPYRTIKIKDKFTPPLASDSLPVELENY